MSQITISSASSKPVLIRSAKENEVTVTKSGTINASGSYAIYAPVSFSATLHNSGRVAATQGCAVRFHGGGSVTNGSATDQGALMIGGSYGIHFGAAVGTVTNYGTIISRLSYRSEYSGVCLGGNGVVVNGGASDTKALISASGNAIRASGTAVSVANFGTILAAGPTSYAIYLRAGGSVTNGSAGDTSAIISGYEFGVQTTTDGATVTNLGTIEASSTARSFGCAVHLSAGGTIINGSESDTSASLIGARGGVYLIGSSNHGLSGTTPSTVANYGTISGNNVAGVYIRLGENARVVNGSPADEKASIDGATAGVSIQGFTTASVTNFGTITGGNACGVYLTDGGQVSNGATNDTNALIKGRIGIAAGGQDRTTVFNFGTVDGRAGSDQAVRLTSGGEVINGSATSEKARLSGGVLMVAGSGNVTNFGTITGKIGVAFYRGLNDSITQTGSGTVVNAGLIESSSGNSGTAIKFGSGNERLIIDPGSALIGRVVGGSGLNTLELASGKGASSIGSIGKSFTRFGPLVIDKGASWTLTGSNSLSGGGAATLSGGATLDITGKLTASSLKMSGSGDTVVLTKPARLVAQIAGFGAGDTIDIAGGVVTGLKFVGGVLTLNNGGRVMGTLRLSGFTGTKFATRSDGGGGTNIVATGLSKSAVINGVGSSDRARAGYGQMAEATSFNRLAAASANGTVAASQYSLVSEGNLRSPTYSWHPNGAGGTW